MIDKKPSELRGRLSKLPTGKEIMDQLVKLSSEREIEMPDTGQKEYKYGDYGPVCRIFEADTTEETPETIKGIYHQVKDYEEMDHTMPFTTKEDIRKRGLIKDDPRPRYIAMGRDQYEKFHVTTFNMMGGEVTKDMSYLHEIERECFMRENVERNMIIEYILRKVIKKPIRGKITKRKIKRRGLMLTYTYPSWAITVRPPEIDSNAGYGVYERSGKIHWLLDYKEEAMLKSNWDKDNVKEMRERGVVLSTDLPNGRNVIAALRSCCK